MDPLKDYYTLEIRKALIIIDKVKLEWEGKFGVKMNTEPNDVISNLKKAVSYILVSFGKEVIKSKLD